MKNPEYRDFLNNIIIAINNMEIFIDRMSYDEFIKDKKTLSAVIMSIEMIGEASKHIPENVKIKNPEFPWERMAKLSDELILRYFQIDNSTLYKTAKDDIPPLKNSILKILKEQDRQ